jgi:hypothetical protein
VTGLADVFKVDIVDTDSDQLYARLFQGLPPNQTYLDDMLPTPVSDPMNPDAGRFHAENEHPISLCTAFHPDASGLQITLFVSDLPFSDATGTTSAGLEDRQEWVLLCQ